MKNFKLVFAGFALSFSVARAQVSETAPYLFPLQNPLLATLAAVSYGTSVKYTKLALEIRPDRSQIRLVEGKHKIKLALFKQSRKAPLVFVISGLGGHGLSGASLLLAEGLYKKGYHVVTLPNPFSWQYVLGVSETATPGYMPSDSVEYYNFMKKVTSYIVKNEKVEVSSFSLVGYSLGGLLSVFLNQQDDLQHYFQFQKTVLLNPAIDLQYGFEVLDSYYREGSKLSYLQKANAFSTVVDLSIELANAPFSESTFKTAFPKLSHLSQLDLKWLIGDNFRSSLRDVIYVSQQIHNTGILKTKASEFSQNARQKEAEGFSFDDYINKILPLTMKNTQSDNLVLQSGLHSLEDYIQENSKIYIFANQDDPIVSVIDIDFLKGKLTKRLTLYPSGGHMGNLWWPQNKQDLNKVLPPVSN